MLRIIRVNIDDYVLTTLTATASQEATPSSPLPTKNAVSSEGDLQAEIRELTQRLEEAQNEIEQLRARQATPSPSQERSAEVPPSDPVVGTSESTDREGIVLGPLTIGGAIRANYTIGDYPETTAPSRGGNGGDFLLDTFRINADYDDDNLIGSLEYRWYNGYNFFHHVWAGYRFENGSQLEAGLTRAPFGPADYGISQSWFFDSHYYMGLADQMDLGIKYSMKFDNLSVDVAYFPRSEWNGNGASVDSARYSFDVVRTATGGYNEEHQANIRAIYTIDSGEIETQLGASALFGLLDGHHTPNGEHYAASLHMVNLYDHWRLATQITRFDYSLGGAKAVPMGAYDYASDAAAEGWIAGASLSYIIETQNISWLDSITPYIEYSSIMKDEKSFNNSDLFIVGAAWASGNWYIYTDLAFSNGNFFVGDKGDFGANVDNESDS